MLETVKEKIAYLRGVIDGESPPEEGRATFLFSRVLQILEQLAADVEELKQAQRELEEYLEEVDFDLAYLCLLYTSCAVATIQTFPPPMLFKFLAKPSRFKMRFERDPTYCPTSSITKTMACLPVTPCLLYTSRCV